MNDQTTESTQVSHVEDSLTLGEVFASAPPADPSSTQLRALELDDGPHGQRLLFLMHGAEASVVAGIMARFLDTLVDAALAKEAEGRVQIASAAALNAIG